MTMYTADNKQNSNVETLQEQLERQYGPAVAQDIMDRLQKDQPDSKVAQPAPGYMDVKAMSEVAERQRAQAMLDIWILREWRKDNDASRPSHKNLISLEGVSLERKCSESIKAYRHSNKTYFEMYRKAMEAFTTKAATPYIIARHCA